MRNNFKCVVEEWLMVCVMDYIPRDRHKAEGGTAVCNGGTTVKALLRKRFNCYRLGIILADVERFE